LQQGYLHVCAQQGYLHVCAQQGRLLGCAPEILPVALALEAALIAGDEGAAAWRDRMGELHQAFRFATARLADAGMLAQDWSAEQAGDWAWAQVQPSHWLHLVGELGWSREEYVRRTTATVMGRLANV
jgi:hypothetical protein